MLNSAAVASTIPTYKFYWVFCNKAVKKFKNSTKTLKSFIKNLVALSAGEIRENRNCNF